MYPDNSQQSRRNFPDYHLSTNTSNDTRTCNHQNTVIALTKAVMGVICILDQFGYANISDWSSLLHSPNPTEVSNILIRTISVQ